VPFLLVAIATAPAHAREAPTSNEGQTSRGGEGGEKGEKDPLDADVTPSFVKEKGCFYRTKRIYYNAAYFKNKILSHRPSIS